MKNANKPILLMLAEKAANVAVFGLRNYAYKVLYHSKSATSVSFISLIFGKLQRPGTKATLIGVIWSGLKYTRLLNRWLYRVYRTTEIENG